MYSVNTRWKFPFKPHRTFLMSTCFPVRRPITHAPPVKHTAQPRTSTRCPQRILMEYIIEVEVEVNKKIYTNKGYF